jgi:hypothetical protein
VRVLEEVPGESGSRRLVRASNELAWSIVGGIVFGLGGWLRFLHIPLTAMASVHDWML